MYATGVTVDRPGALVSHAQALCSVLNETGEALLSRGYTDMAQFVLHSARQGRERTNGLGRRGARTQHLPASQSERVVAERPQPPPIRALLQSQRREPKVVNVMCVCVLVCVEVSGWETQTAPLRLLLGEMTLGACFSA